MSFKFLLIAPAACLALCGCNTVGSHIGDEDAALGEAVRYNAAVQTINPDPVYAQSAAQPGDNGDKGARSVKRYRTDEVNERHRSEAQQTTGISTTSGVGTGPR